MATRSHIGKLLDDGSIKYIYCHFDGYPEHNGEILKEHYKTEAKIDALLELGDISILGEEIGEKQNFHNKQSNNMCLAYGRDRGDTDIEARIAEGVYEFRDQTYSYLWDGKSWQCYHGGYEIKF